MVQNNTRYSAYIESCEKEHIYLRIAVDDTFQIIKCQLHDIILDENAYDIIEKFVGQTVECQVYKIPFVEIFDNMGCNLNDILIDSNAAMEKFHAMLA